MAFIEDLTDVFIGTPRRVATVIFIVIFLSDPKMYIRAFLSLLSLLLNASLYVLVILAVLLIAYCCFAFAI